MDLEELLGRFRSEDMAHALRGLGLAASGTKGQRLNRLLTATTATGASDVLALFETDDLYRVCIKLGVDTGSQADMVDRLARQVATKDTVTPPVEATDPKVDRLSSLKRVGIIAALAALLYRLYRTVRRSR